MEHDDSHEDYITWLKVLRKYGYAVGIDKPYLKYRLSEGGKSRNKLKSAVSKQANEKEKLFSVTALPLKGRVVFSFAPMHCMEYGSIAIDKNECMEIVS